MKNQELPSGTVSFLLTDIEGSTKLWQQDPGPMRQALARHHEILRQAIEANRGYVFQIIGDAFCAAFNQPSDMLAAALAVQRGLRDEEWAGLPAIRVRIALHAGAVDVRPGDYTTGEYVSGLTLSRTARLLSAGHGGQILLSTSAYELSRDDLPAGVTILDLGAHRLRDLARPETIYQVVAPDLQADFPPLKTLDSRPNNLPLQLTSFVGREREIGEIKDLINQARLVTLTGLGGVGKTRLALQAAAALLDAYPGGVWLVELAGLDGAGNVPKAVAEALSVPEQAGLDLTTAILRSLRSRPGILLLLDNCEHLLDACASLAVILLPNCPELQILATSRQALGVSGEMIYPVSGLSLPGHKDVSPGSLLEHSEAVRLFAGRARLVQPHFELSEANTPPVASICQGLEGIPLAIELAAARLNIFSPQEIAARLDDHLSLLKARERRLPKRHQTLRAALEWSYSLLSLGERRLFDRLSVFRGGFTLEAAEAVCGEVDADDDLLDLLASLVEKSMLVAEAGPQGVTRYRLLETLRQYGWARLAQSGETEEIQRRHANTYLAFGEKAEPETRSHNQVVWLNRLASEHDNLRAALQWAFERAEGQDDQAAREIGVRLSQALWWFWFVRWHITEGRAWLERSLSQPLDSLPPLVQVRTACYLAFFNFHNPERQYWLSEQGLSLAMRAEDDEAIALARLFTGLFSSHDDPIRRKSLIEQSLALYRSLGDPFFTSAALFALCRYFDSYPDLIQFAHSSYLDCLQACREAGNKYYDMMARLCMSTNFILKGDFLEARKLLLECRSVSEEIGFINGLYYSRANMAYVEMNLGNFDPALELLQETLEISQTFGSLRHEAFTMLLLGDLARAQGELDRASDYYQKSLSLSSESEDLLLRALALIGIGLLALKKGDSVQAIACQRDALAIIQVSGDAGERIQSVDALAASFAADRQHEKAARLFAAIEGFLAMNGFKLTPIDQVEHNRWLAFAKDNLNKAVFTQAWEQGKALAEKGWESIEEHALQP